MKKTAMLEIDYALHTLFYRASIYARNRYLMRKYRLLIQYYGLLLKYSPEKINRHIEEHRRNALNVRRRKEKNDVNYPSLHKMMNRSASLRPKRTPLSSG